VHALEFGASKHCKGIFYEGKAAGLYPGRESGVARLGRDLLCLVEQSNAKVLGGDQKAIVAEQGLHPRRKREWIQIKEGSERRHQIGRGVQNGTMRCCAESRVIFRLRLVVTGSPAFAGDDDGKLNDPTKIIAL
jgi:hypothetical protein